MGNKKKRIAILASGRGSNAEQIMKRFENHEDIEVKLVLSNKKDAGVLDIADAFNVPKSVFKKEDFIEESEIGGAATFLEFASDANVSLFV